MPHPLKNSLALGSALGLALYWSVGYLITDPYLSVAISVWLLLTGGLTLLSYAEGAFRVVVLGERDTEGHGGHWAAYGMFLLALGSVYGGIFNLAWVIAGVVAGTDPPMSWLGTPQSNFGRILMGVGFAFIWRSPEPTRGAGRNASTLMLIAVGSIAITVAFFAGTMVKQPVPGLTVPVINFAADRPTCPADRPVWGTRAGIYHTPESAYRRLMSPDRCFRDIGEAQRAGFRPPK